MYKNETTLERLIAASLVYGVASQTRPLPGIKRFHFTDMATIIAGTSVHVCEIDSVRRSSSNLNAKGDVKFSVVVLEANHLQGLHSILSWMPVRGVIVTKQLVGFTPHGGEFIGSTATMHNTPYECRGA